MSRSSRSSAAALLAYALISFLYFGVRLLPHPGRLLVGSGGDPDIFVWSFAWWPHAILHGLNPIHTNVIWAPDGVNLAWVTSVPALSLVFAPLTLLFGPGVAYNTAAILLPALAAWTAFLLCRHLTGRFWPSAAGGYLFGFSSYMLGQTLGHMHMTAVFLVPLVALVVLRFLEGELAGRGLAWRLGLLLGVQFGLSTELLFTLTLVLAAGIAIAALTVRALRPRLRALLGPLTAAYGLALLVASPLVVYALIDFETGAINTPDLYSADLLNLIVPTHLLGIAMTWTNELANRFPANDAERGAYIGLPALAIVGWYALRRRTAETRFLLFSLAALVVAELGTALWVGGERIVTLPWDWLAQLPLLNNTLPVRFALFTSLIVSVVVALWAAGDARRWARIGLTALAVLTLTPTIREANWTLHPERPEFFAHGNLVRACLVKNENVLVYPYAWRNHSMLWQAENDFWFRMAGGYVRPDTPPTFAPYAAVYKTMSGGADPTIDDILELARAKQVARILSVERYGHPSADELQRGPGSVQLLGGVFVSPGCGHSPIARQVK